MVYTSTKQLRSPCRLIILTIHGKSDCHHKNICLFVCNINQQVCNAALLCGNINCCTQIETQDYYKVLMFMNLMFSILTFDCWLTILTANC